jgi:hypothetical protein
MDKVYDYIVVGSGFGGGRIILNYSGNNRVPVYYAMNKILEKSDK